MMQKKINKYTDKNLAKTSRIEYNAKKLAPAQKKTGLCKLPSFKRNMHAPQININVQGNLNINGNLVVVRPTTSKTSIPEEKLELDFDQEDVNDKIAEDNLEKILTPQRSPGRTLVFLKK